MSSLSDKSLYIGDNHVEVIPTEDVKEFIKELKRFNMSSGTHNKKQWMKTIDKKAGEKLL